jgi:hypothetical protein
MPYPLFMASSKLFSVTGYWVNVLPIKALKGLPSIFYSRFSFEGQFRLPTRLLAVERERNDRLQTQLKAAQLQIELQCGGSAPRDPYFFFWFWICDKIWCTLIIATPLSLLSITHLPCQQQGGLVAGKIKKLSTYRPLYPSP